ncbi:macro domain-containing protein [Candidatus Poriferisodalis sp.]|uniref:macro domain-containing protein n=1 Tax=Candidatus Poriferisodalis sp. TaxID=3101277 RepID=UPI003AF8BC48
MSQDGLSLFSRALWGPGGPSEDAATRRDWNDVAPIRQPVPIPPPQMLLSGAEMQTIAMGYVPVDINARWFASMEGDCLYLHRGWTGLGIYEVTFAAKETWFMITSARIECDPDVYNRDSDLGERERLRNLIAHVSGEPMPPLLPVPIQSKPLLEAVLGDITAERVDAIVNPASANLLGGGGVDAATHRAAGPELRAYCQTVGGCELGRAKISPGFRLASQWAIHTVGPQWRGGSYGEAVLLESCYRESLARADEVGAERVAIPAIATGAHGYPRTSAAEIAVKTVRSTPTKVREIHFVCFDALTLQAYEESLNRSG